MLPRESCLSECSENSLEEIDGDLALAMVSRACFCAVYRLCSILTAESVVVPCTVLVEYGGLRAEGGILQSFLQISVGGYRMCCALADVGLVLWFLCTLNPIGLVWAEFSVPPASSQIDTQRIIID